MKIILIFLLFSTFAAFGQQDSLALKQRTKDTLILTLQTELKATKQTVTQVLFLIDQSVSQMNVLAGNKEIRGEEKMNRFKQLGAERDKKIEQLLSREQVIKLQQFMAARRQMSKT